MLFSKEDDTHFSVTEELPTGIFPFHKAIEVLLHSFKIFNKNLKVFCDQTVKNSSIINTDVIFPFSLFERNTDKPTIKLNFKNNIYSCIELSHEMGHIIHDSLIKKTNIKKMPSFLFSEINSTLFETIFLREVLRNQENYGVKIIDNYIKIKINYNYDLYLFEDFIYSLPLPSLEKIDSYWEKLKRKYNDFGVFQRGWHHYDPIFLRPFYVTSYVIGSLGLRRKRVFFYMRVAEI